MLAPVARAALLCCLGVLSATCGGAASSAHAQPMLLVAYPQGLTELRLDGAEARVLIPRDVNGRMPLAVAVSPDGRRLAYLLSPSSAEATVDSGVDLWLADRDGSHRRRLIQHPSPNHSFRAVRWEDASHVLAVVDTPAGCAGCNPATTTTQTLERVDVATGAATPLRDGVVDFDLAPGGGSVVFPAAVSEVSAILEIASLAGDAARMLVGPGAGFAQVGSARYSPDGNRIAFAAADRRRANAHVRLVSARASGAAPAPDADSLPQDVWIVDATGDQLRRVVTLRENAPTLAWDADGATLYALAAAALYRIDVASGAVQRIGRATAGGFVAYAPAAR